jgi:hypothetical protein
MVEVTKGLAQIALLQCFCAELELLATRARIEVPNELARGADEL